jgi:hypothetical protein
MPRADFKVTLVFRGYPIPDGILGEPSATEMWLRDFRAAVVSHAEGSGMCSDWSNAFRGGEAFAHDLTESEPETHVFTVSVRPRLTARVAVNSGRSPQEAMELLNEMFHNIAWDEVSGAPDGALTEDSVEAYVEHYGSYSPDEAPEEFVEVEV